MFLPGLPKDSFPFNDISDYCDMDSHGHPQRQSEDIRQPASLFQPRRCRQDYYPYLDQKASRLKEGNSVAAVYSGLEEGGSLVPV